jgi:glycosyltransferase involved in cell wall biosynthesis
MPGARLIRHSRNRGYGASIRDGFAAGTATKVLIIDADLEYPPEAIPEFVAALDEYPVVYGSRFLRGRPSGMPPFRRIGNRAVSTLFNRLFHQKTTDFYTGMKALRQDALEALDLKLDGFEHVVEMGAQLSRAGFQIREIPVDYTPRSRGVSKMKHLPEMLKYLWYVTRYRFATGRLQKQCAL